MDDLFLQIFSFEVILVELLEAKGVIFLQVKMLGRCHKQFLTTFFNNLLFPGTLFMLNLSLIEVHGLSLNY